VVFIVGLALPMVLCLAALGATKLLQLGRLGWSLAHFTSFLASVVRRNLPLGQSLEAYAADLPWAGGLARRTMLRTMAGRVDNGQPLSEVMACYPGTFPAAYRALVRAGERSGNLGAVLAQLRRLAELDESAARQGAAAVLYPLVLGMVVSGGGGFMGVFIIPKFVMMFEEMAIPNRNYELMFLAGGLGPVILMGLLAAGGILGMWPLIAYAGERLAPRLVAALARLRWRLPLFRRYERRRAVGQYALAAGQLLEAGVPAVEALEIAAGAAGSWQLERMALGAARRVAEGARLSAALAAEDPGNELPPEFLWYVGLGEAGSDLPAALGRAAESALLRSQNALRALLDLVFPAGVAAVGVMVGLLAFSLFATLTGLMGGIEA